jgi:hypothetical protein
MERQEREPYAALGVFVDLNGRIVVGFALARRRRLRAAILPWLRV